MGRIDRLAERYGRFIALPWGRHLAGGERCIFLVYNKSDERRVRARRDLFAMATREARHGWIECDLTDAFAHWMASAEYRDSYFAAPEDLELKLEEDFLEHVATRVRRILASPDANEDTVVAVFGIAALFGFLRVSELMRQVESSIRGRLVVFFPGEYEDNNYRLLDARDGWNYLAVPITMNDERTVYDQ